MSVSSSASPMAIGNLPRLAEWAAAPKVTTEDLEVEKANLRCEERVNVEADIFGGRRPLRRRSSTGTRTYKDDEKPEENGAGSDDEEEFEGETESGSHQAILELYEALELSVPPEDKAAVLEAKDRNVLSHDHLMMFVRWSEFNFEVAAQRLALYWEERLCLFQDRAFLPLRDESPLDSPEEGAMFPEDAVAYSFGFMRHVPCGKDLHGRHIFFFDVSRQDKKRYARESMLRALWCALEAPFHNDPLGQINGYVILMTNEHASFSLFDRKLMVRYHHLCRNVLPLANRATHMCYPPRINAAITLPLYLFLIGKEARMRFMVHSGPRLRVVPEIESYGIARHQIPTELGGTFVMEKKG